MLFYRDGQGVAFNLDKDSEYGGLFSTCFGLLTLHWFVWFFCGSIPLTSSTLATEHEVSTLLS